jgi:hypothetical protein
MKAAPARLMGLPSALAALCPDGAGFPLPSKSICFGDIDRRVRADAMWLAEH